MIKIENVQVAGWEPAIRGMRNPMNSWDRSDSHTCHNTPCSKCSYFVDSACTHKTPGCSFVMGDNDLQLANSLSQGGSVHAKYRRMIVLHLDITAPLYWWKEFDTYKVGTVANSCSTMHKIHEKEFALGDFSHEHLFIMEDTDFSDIPVYGNEHWDPNLVLKMVIKSLNFYRARFLETKDKKYWWQMIQLLPSSYNQRRTVMLNYEVIDNIRHHRANHKLDEWREFCAWTDTLPYINDICPKEE